MTILLMRRGSCQFRIDRGIFLRRYQGIYIPKLYGEAELYIC